MGLRTEPNGNIIYFVVVTWAWVICLILFEGEKVNLTCTASNDFDSSESLKIKWYGPRGTQLTSEIKNVNIYNTTNSITGQITSVLLLDSVNDTDTGGYTCRALNHPKSYTEKKTSLNVECEIVVYCKIYVEYVYSSLNHIIIYTFAYMVGLEVHFCVMHAVFL